MRTGDYVHHAPTGEDWIVAYIDGDKMGWCGWPPGEAQVSDCTVTRVCTDEEHLGWLKQLARKSSAYPEDKSSRMAQAALKPIQPLT